MAVLGTREIEPLPVEDEVSELKLKSETAKTTSRKLLVARLTHDVQFFGISGSQLAAGMQGINLAWNGEVLVVTSDSYPNEERWVFPATIAYMKWAT